MNRFIALSIAICAASGLAAAAAAQALPAGKPGYLKESHADGASCSFWLKADDKKPNRPNVVETDFQTYWVNINGKDMGFKDESPSQIMNILTTPLGVYRLVEGNPIDRECEECSYREYKLLITPKAGPQTSNDLIGLCGS